MPQFSTTTGAHADGNTDMEHAQHPALGAFKRPAENPANGRAHKLLKQGGNSSAQLGPVAQAAVCARQLQPQAWNVAACTNDVCRHAPCQIPCTPCMQVSPLATQHQGQAPGGGRSNKRQQLLREEEDLGTVSCGGVHAGNVVDWLRHTLHLTCAQHRTQHPAGWQTIQERGSHEPKDRGQSCLGGERCDPEVHTHTQRQIV